MRVDCTNIIFGLNFCDLAIDVNEKEVLQKIWLLLIVTFLTLMYSEQLKLCGYLVFLNAIGLIILHYIQFDKVFFNGRLI